MTQIHTRYEFSKRLKEFLGDSAPEPMAVEYWCGGCGQIQPNCDCDGGHDVPAYQLHDLLSRQFTKAMENRINEPYKDKDRLEYDYILLPLLHRYREGGLPAVESALMEMMEDK